MSWKRIAEVPEGFTLCTPEDSCKTCKSSTVKHKGMHFFQDRPDGSQVVKWGNPIPSAPGDETEGPDGDIENDYKSQEEKDLDRIEEGYERQRDKDIAKNMGL